MASSATVGALDPSAAVVRSLERRLRKQQEEAGDEGPIIELLPLNTDHVPFYRGLSALQTRKLLDFFSTIVPFHICLHSLSVLARILP
jgi:hypothetical protein